MADEKFKLLPYEDMIFKGMVAKGDAPEKVEGEFLEFSANKIPMKLFGQIMTFFDHCEKKLDSEGFLLLLYRDGEWSLGCPDQKVSGGSVDAHPENHPEEFHGAVGDIHSHPGMSAFHSGIDDADERKHKHGVYMVMSSSKERGFTPFSIELDVKGYARGRAFQFDPMKVFDVDSPLSAALGVQIPELWKERVKKEVFRYSKWKGRIGKFIDDKKNKKNQGSFGGSLFDREFDRGHEPGSDSGAGFGFNPWRGF